MHVSLINIVSIHQKQKVPYGSCIFLFPFFLGYTVRVLQLQIDKIKMILKREVIEIGYCRPRRVYIFPQVSCLMFVRGVGDPEIEQLLLFVIDLGYNILRPLGVSSNHKKDMQYLASKDQTKTVQNVDV